MLGSPAVTVHGAGGDGGIGIGLSVGSISGGNNGGINLGRGAASAATLWPPLHPSATALYNHNSTLSSGNCSDIAAATAAAVTGGGGNVNNNILTPHLAHQQLINCTAAGIVTSVGSAPLAAQACISNNTNTSASSAAEAFNRYGLYSVFPGGGAAAAGAAFYSHAAAATAGAFGRPPTATTYHAQHKLISETTGCYIFGAPTPPPGSPYSPLPVTHLELLAKNFNNNNIVQQQSLPIPTPGSTPINFTQEFQAINNNNNNSININKNNQIILKKSSNYNPAVVSKQQRWSGTPSMLPLTVKTENITTSKRTSLSCACRNGNSSDSSPSSINNKSSNKFDTHGCSRTTPWTPNSVSSSTIISPQVQVKCEPATTPACQVAEITTSNHTIQNNHQPSAAAFIKIEAQSPTSAGSGSSSSSLTPAPACFNHKIESNDHLQHHHCDDSNIISTTSSIVQTTMSSITTCTTGNGTIPVGIAVARQRLHQELAPQQLQNNTGLLTTAAVPASIKEFDSTSVTTAAAMTVGVAANGGGPLIQCNDDRTNNISSWPIPPAHNSSLAAPTLWQYPAPVSMEPPTMLPVPVPMPPVGFQLVRDPTTGHFFVIPTASFDQLQQAVVWPSYPQPSSHVLLPPIPPPPLAPLQFLGSATSDYLTTASTTLHQHTQTHSTRLVALTTDTGGNKRKIPIPSHHTLIKIESDCNVPTADQTTKTLQAVSTMATNTNTMPVFATTDQSITPLLTTHVFYQHPTNLIQIASQQSQQPLATAPPNTATSVDSTTICRSQATSPVPCLTPPPEVNSHFDTEDNVPDVQDASNQTDTPFCSEDDNTNISNIPERDCSPHVEKAIKQTNNVESTTLQIPPAPNILSTSESVQISTTSIQITEIRPRLIETKPTAKIIEIVEPPQPVPESSKEVDSTTNNDEDTTNDDEQVVSTTTNKNVDLSGLELLSNSIVELENYQKHFEPSTTTIKVERPDSDNETTDNKKSEDVVRKIADMSLIDQEKCTSDNCCGQRTSEANGEDLGGLGLLCALAEQRIMEEKNPVIRFKHHMDIDCKKKLKRCLEERYSLEDQKNKKFKVGDFEFERKPEVQAETPEKKDDKEDRKPCCNNSQLSKMNELEKDMRIRLAELQRQCTEKQLELDKLTPKLNDNEHDDNIENSKKSKKIKSKHRRSTSPPQLDKYEPVVDRKCNLNLKPPVLNAIKRFNNLKIDVSNDNPFSNGATLSPALSDNSIQKHSASKKRKVGRPKKLSTPNLSEMIVAKKPKSLVGYLLAAKSRLHSQTKNSPNSSPPRYHIEDSPSPKPKLSKSHRKKYSSSKSKKKSEKKRNKHNVDDSDSGSKIRPKLKAEPKIKLFFDEDGNSSNEWSPDDNNTTTLFTKTVNEEQNNNDNHNSDEDDEVNDNINKKKDSRCVLNSEHLEIDKLRVLTSMGGLFYAGVLSAIQAPDVYAITLDGERGNRPHIMSREEILRDAILEVSPATTEELLPNTRLCAYWSQQYRCLYPGTVAEPGTPDPTLDHRFVCVEFDDGDSGRIALEDIRLLPSDYPIIEYDPNPLLSLSKRKRRISVNSNIDEKRNNNNEKVDNGISQKLSKMEVITAATIEEKVRDERKSSHKERKKLRKHRHNKLKKLMKKHSNSSSGDGDSEEKKHKRKHKCCDDHCKHRRHHKKHRKHRKHHHDKDKNTLDTKIITEINTQDVIKVDNEYNQEQNDCFDKVKEDNNSTLEVDMKKEILSSMEGEKNEDMEEQQNEIVESEQDEFEEEIEENIKVDIKKQSKKKKKVRERQESVESRSKMAAFLPARQLWGWSGKGYKRPGAKGRAKKLFFKSIQRGKETISVGDAAVFLSTGRPDRPYIGRIEAMWESWGNSMVVKVKWFYHPEETIGCPLNLKYPGALFESPHVDENDVQTISHKCEVLPLKDYTSKLGSDPQRYETIYDNNDIYYRAGYYDPTTIILKMDSGIPLAPE